MADHGCDFALDLGEFRASFGDLTSVLAPEIAGVVQRFEGLVVLRTGRSRSCWTDGAPIRIVASVFDGHALKA